jgi:hypothetical protein
MLVQAAGMSGPPKTMGVRGRREPPSASSVTWHGARVAHGTSKLCNDGVSPLDAIDVELELEQVQLRLHFLDQEHVLVAFEPLAFARPVDDRVRDDRVRDDRVR